MSYKQQSKTALRLREKDAQDIILKCIFVSEILIYHGRGAIDQVYK